MTEEEPDVYLNIPCPHSDLLSQISHRLSKLALREGGLLDLETSGVSVPRQIRQRLDALKSNTQALHRLLLEASSE